MADGLRWAMLAIHEAGHSIAATCLGCGIRSVSLDPPELEVVFLGASRRTELVVLAAGDAAVKRAGCADVSPADEKDAQKLCRQQGLSQLDWAAAKRQAAELVDRDWPAVERVAAALVDRMHLDGADVRRLMAGRAPDPASDNAQLLLLRLALWNRATEVKA